MMPTRCLLAVALLAAAVPRSASATDAFEHAARLAAERYRDVTVAGVDGYAGPLSVTGEVHLVRADRLVGPGAPIDPARPSALLYEHDGGRYELRAVVFMLAEPDQRPPGILRGLDWHRHAVCAGSLGLHAAPEGRCRPDERSFVSGLMAHVWRSTGGEGAVVCQVVAQSPRS